MTSFCLQLNTILIAAANQISCQMCQFQCSFHIEKLGHFTHVDLIMLLKLFKNVQLKCLPWICV
jgi:hypothetical protein